MKYILLLFFLFVSENQADDRPISSFIEDLGHDLTRISNSILGPKITKHDHDHEEYDFIIIGAGAAGTVLANRLSEVPHWKILLLEAGIPENPIGLIPQVSQILQATQYSWQYQTIPQTNACLGMVNNSCNQASGKGLGGGSIISDSIYSRGSRQDYDNWASLGNPSWSYQNVLPYFKKAEDVHLKHYDESYHGTHGPNNVELENNPSRIRKPFLEAIEELNYKILDYNGAEQIGFHTPQVTTLNGRRNSNSRAYLSNIHRDNLVIKTSSYAKRILFDSTTAKAIVYERNGKTLYARSRREIIVSAGVYNSPKILQLSGIGPKNLLEPLRIKTISDLQVGENLRDHLAFLGLNFVYNKTHHDIDYLDSFSDWILHGNGHLTSCGIDVLGYITSTRTNDSRHADIELALIPISLNQGYRVIQPVTNILKDVYDSFWKNTEGKDSFGILVILSRARSRGNVKIQSRNYKTAPEIDPRYLEDPDDVEVMLEGIKKALEIANATSFWDVGFTINRRRVLGCEDFAELSDEYWRCAVRRLSISALHASGTNKMGPDDDPEAVVDDRLKVYGVGGLRVVDASVIPNTNTGHMMAPVVMVAEKASDIIKTDWGVETDH